MKVTTFGEIYVYLTWKDWRRLRHYNERCDNFRADHIRGSACRASCIDSKNNFFQCCPIKVLLDKSIRLLGMIPASEWRPKRDLEDGRQLLERWESMAEGEIPEKLPRDWMVFSVTTFKPEQWRSNLRISASNGGEGEYEQKNEETELHLSMLDNSTSATFIKSVWHKNESIAWWRNTQEIERKQSLKVFLNYSFAWTYWLVSN